MKKICFICGHHVSKPCNQDSKLDCGAYREYLKAIHEEIHDYEYEEKPYYSIDYQEEDYNKDE